MNSNILIHLTKEVETSDNKFLIDEYLTDLYVYTKQFGNSDILYLKEKNELFIIDYSAKSLKRVSLKNQQEQMLKFKEMFYRIEATKKQKDMKRIVEIEGKGVNVSLEGTAYVSNFQEIEHTAHWEAYNLLNTTAMINIEIDREEVLASIEIDINLQGKIIKNKTTITELKAITSDVKKYDYLLKYRIN